MCKIILDWSDGRWCASSQKFSASNDARAGSSAAGHYHTGGLLHCIWVDGTEFQWGKEKA